MAHMESQLADMFRAVQRGDFTFRLQGSEPLIQQANSMMAQLDTIMLKELNQKVVVTMAGFESTISMAKLEQISDHLMQRTQSMAAATEEMSATVRVLADQAEDVGTLSQTAKNTVLDGIEKMNSATEAMAGTLTQMQDAIAQIDKLKRISQEIEALLMVIRKISDQTNLLALNATIEAARAGEAGKGFAVVASEVKELSRQTAKATEDIAEKSTGIQKAVTTVVESISHISSTVQNAAGSLNTTQESMHAIEHNMLNVDTRVTDIRNATQDQTVAAGEIAEGVAAASSMSGQLADMARSTLSSTDHVDEMLRSDLKEFSEYNITNAVIQLAKSDHMLWKKRLTDMVIGRATITTNEVTDHHHCRLGKWYYSDGLQRFGSNPDFKTLETPHAEVHKLAKQAVDKFNRGDTDGAIKDVEAIGPVSAEVIRLLDKLER